MIRPSTCRTSDSNAILLAVDAMRSAGMAPVDLSQIRADGGFCRFDAEGDRRHKRAAWCRIWTDGPRPVVVFGHWSRQISETVVLGDGSALSPAERERQRIAFEHARAARDVQTRHQQEQARTTAESQWLEAGSANDFHPYLVRKRVDAAGLRERHGALLIALRDEKGKIWNIQRISPDGKKRFLRGGRVKGLFHWIGGTVKSELLICEGVATGKSLHAATGMPVVVAFSAGNLKEVAKTIRAKYPTARITIAADNDEKPDGRNPGVEAGTAAASAINAFLAVPPMIGDFNDYAAFGGHLESFEEKRDERAQS